MTEQAVWIDIKEEKPSKGGHYAVVVVQEGTSGSSFFPKIPSSQSIKYLDWHYSLRFLQVDENGHHVYEKYYAFRDRETGLMSMVDDKITHWLFLPDLPSLNKKA